MDQSGRIATVKAYASQCKIEKGFYEKVEALLNRIDNELRKKRNFYVHSFWDTSPDIEEISRINFRSDVTRPQAYQLKLDPMRITTYQNVQAVLEFSNEIRQAVFELGSLQGQVSMSEPYKAARKIAETTSAGRA